MGLLLLPEHEERQKDSRDGATQRDGILGTPALPFPVVIEQAKASGILHLSYQALYQVPDIVWRISHLFRLDIGHNSVSHLSKDIGALVELEELWINDNPLQEIPSELSMCTKLRHLDIRGTKVKELPIELGRLRKYQLSTIASAETPLHLELFGGREPRLRSAVEKFSAEGHKCRLSGPEKALLETEEILKDLEEKDTRKQLADSLTTALTDDVFRDYCATKEGAKEAVEVLVQRVMALFPENDDMRSIIRNAARLFTGSAGGGDPGTPAQVNPDQLKARFVSLKRENERKRLAAELELKIRKVYYDAVDPAKVPGMVEDIYREVDNLDDVKFLIRYASDLFPPSSKDVNAKKLFEGLKALQDKLARERAAAVSLVMKAVSTIYSDVNREKVEALVKEVTDLFKKTEEIKSLAADASRYFPSEYLSAVPQKIKEAFREANPLAATASG